MDSTESLSPQEKRVIGASLLCMLLCLLVLLFGDRYFWNDRDAFSSKQKIGKIRSPSNDTRRRADGSYVWYGLHNEDDIMAGDSIFTGANSSLQVTLASGGDIDMGENSLVAFAEIDNQKMANLVGGNFRVKVNGEMKVAIDGKVTVLKGINSEAQIFMDKDKKPKLKMLKGDVKMEIIADSSVNLDKHSSAPPVDLTSKFAKYTWRFKDLYQLLGTELTEKAYRPARVALAVDLNWSQKKSSPALIQISPQNDFRETVDFTSDDGQLKLTTPYLGKNYWRVSSDEGATWSLPQTFDVGTQFLSQAAPLMPGISEDVILVGDSVPVPLRIESTVEAVGYVAEASLTPNFEREKTKVFWSPSSTLQLSFYHAGDYYYRFRAVTQSQELSEWSSTKKFAVVTPEKPLAPILAHLNAHALPLGSNFAVSWASNEPRVVTEILDPQGNLVAKFPAAHALWKPSSVGHYQIRAYAFDKYGQMSAPSLPQDVDSTELKLAKQEPKKTRKPAAVDTTLTLKTDDIKPAESMNAKYSTSQLSFEGFVWSLQSSQQYFQSQDTPVVTGVGIRSLTWGQHWGFEGSVRTGAVAMNSSGQQTSMKDLEGRVHYRFNTAFPFGLARSLQTSLFTGYEVYQNTGNLYANQYSLVKFGTSVDFPLASRWSTGGYLAYGLGTDQSTKEEISGNVTYYMQRDWSLGVGYRLNLFNAGSSASAPGGYLPYREGYTEAYSIINYHF